MRIKLESLRESYSIIRLEWNAENSKLASETALKWRESEFVSISTAKSRNEISILMPTKYSNEIMNRKVEDG